MITETEILKWFWRNFSKSNTKSKYYIEHEKGSDLFVVRSVRFNTELIKELMNNNRPIDPQVLVGVPMKFDLDEIDEPEIEAQIANSIRYVIDRHLTRGVLYTLEHENGSDTFIRRRVN